MKRRSFIQKSSLLAFSISSFGSISWNGKSYEGDTATTTDILGPFYRPDSPIRSNLIQEGSKGEVLHLKGTIYQKKSNKPLPDALIEIWQCDENQVYDNTSDEFRFRGGQITGKDGKYSFTTIVPVPYKASETQWRPAHIHLRVSSPDQQDLISQIYFKGDPHLQEDSSSSSPLAVHRILEIGKNRQGENEITFDINMQDAFQLDPSVYNKISGLYRMEEGNVEFTFVDDLLYMKRNGQIVEALVYKGNNTFEGGLGHIKSRFELLEDEGSKVYVTIGDNDANDLSNARTLEGLRYLKY